ncbi:MAG: glycosyltransferase [Planctomycetaceae bacterium]|nr:glycosyltransferase [Planctomycetaceae bacterium]MCB9953471.1 glycosyltransferase [Planctomycetaceae bacterium]
MLSVPVDGAQRGVSSPKDVSFTLVIPAYNEADVITQAMTEAVESLQRLVTRFEVIIVDDGCSDETPQIVEQFAAQDSRVRLLRQPRNMGYGAALRRGFEAATTELVAFTDADCQFHLDDLRYLIELADQFDVVSGYRIDRKDSSLRRFCSWGYNTLVQILMGSPIRDIDCALKVFRRDVLVNILPNATGFFANTEMFSKAREQGLNIVDVGVRHRARAAGHSKVKLTDVPHTLDSLLPYWWKMHFAGARPTRESDVSPLWTWMAGVGVLLLAALILGANLTYPLIEPDEGRYAEIMREMASTGDWLVPRLHHQPYLDKPPLFYWLGAASIKLFGPHDWAVRLVPVLSAWLTIAATFLFGRKMLGTKSALLASMVLTLSIGFMLCGRYLILDSLLSLFVTTALFSGVVASFSTKDWSWRMWFFSAICCALGVLTKGPVAVVLVVPPLFAHCWLRRIDQGMNWKAWASYAGVIMLANLPWYIAIATSVPEFSGYFFWEHNVARFLSGSNHPAPAWFYAPILLLGWMPWCGLLFPLVPFLASRSPKRREQRNAKVGFLAMSVVWCLFFFSLSSGKLPTYIIPCFPALALLIGHYLQSTKSPFTAETFQLEKLQELFSKASVGMCLAGFILPYVLWRMHLESTSFAITHAVVWAMCGLVFLAVRTRLTPKVAWWAYCVVALATTVEATHHVFPEWADRNAIVHEETQLAETLNAPTTKVACVEHSPGSVPFYLDRDDVVLLEISNAKALEDFVNSSDESYLIVDEKVDVASLEGTLPKGRSAATVGEGPRGTILRVGHEVPVESVQQSPPSPVKPRVAMEKTDSQASLR